jgi:hypothetical protein
MVVINVVMAPGLAGRRVRPIRLGRMPRLMPARRLARVGAARVDVSVAMAPGGIVGRGTIYVSAELFSLQRNFKFSRAKILSASKRLKEIEYVKENLEKVHQKRARKYKFVFE